MPSDEEIIRVHREHESAVRKRRQPLDGFGVCHPAPDWGVCLTLQTDHSAMHYRMGEVLGGLCGMHATSPQFQEAVSSLHHRHHHRHSQHRAFSSTQRRTSRYLFARHCCNGRSFMRLCSACLIAIQDKIEKAQLQGKTEAYERTINALSQSAGALSQSSGAINFLAQNMIQQVSIVPMRPDVYCNRTSV